MKGRARRRAHLLRLWQAVEHDRARRYHTIVTEAVVELPDERTAHHAMAGAAHDLQAVCAAAVDAAAIAARAQPAEGPGGTAGQQRPQHER